MTSVILVTVFIQLTKICNNFYFILVENVKFIHSFSFSQQKCVVLQSKLDKSFKQ